VPETPVRRQPTEGQDPMAHIDSAPNTANIELIAEPHQSTVMAIVRAAELGLFTAAQAQRMIDRVRAHLTALPITGPAVSPSFVTEVSPAAADTRPDGSDGTLS